MSRVTFVDVLMIKPVPMGGLTVSVEERETFYFDTDSEGLQFAEYVKEQGGKVTNYGSIGTVSLNAAKAGLQVMYEMIKV